METKAVTAEMSRNREIMLVEDLLLFIIVFWRKGLQPAPIAGKPLKIPRLPGRSRYIQLCVQRELA